MQAQGQSDSIQSSIIHDIGEGILTFGTDGKIGIVNPAAEAILGITKEELHGKNSTMVLFRFKENDQFNQTILDAIYDMESRHENVVPYFDGKKQKQLHVMATFLHENGERKGVIVVISDLTEFTEMEYRYIQQINKLIDSMDRVIQSMGDVLDNFIEETEEEDDESVCGDDDTEEGDGSESPEGGSGPEDGCDEADGAEGAGLED